MERTTLPRPLATFNKGYFTPVFIPDESYCFFATPDEWITYANYNGLQLCIIDSDDNIVHTFSNAVKILEHSGIFSGVPQPYKIYLEFAFPEIPTGNYQFMIRDSSNGLEFSRSLHILCDHRAFETTARVWYRHDSSRGGIDYDRLPDSYYNKLRLPLHVANIDNESETENYRNITDDKFRTITSYVDQVYSIEFYNIDEPTFKAITEILEHDRLVIDMAIVTRKTQIQSEVKAKTNMLDASFECYLDQELFAEDSLYNFGEAIIYCGSESFHPNDIINQNL